MGYDGLKKVLHALTTLEEIDRVAMEEKNYSVERK